MNRKRMDGTDLVLSEICYGTALFGADVCGAAVDTCIRTFRDAGGNFFDTAHGYAYWVAAGAGCSERALGDYMRRNGKGDIIVGTKGGLPAARGYRQTEHWLSPETLESDLSESLERLGVDTIDLYWLHRDDTRLPVGEIVETMNRQIRRGRIRYIGTSNWRTDRIAAANAYASAHGLQGFVANQPQWNLAKFNTPNPDPATDTSDGKAVLYLEEPDLAWHRRTRLPLVPYSASAGGYFATGGARAGESYENPVSRGRLERAQALARELGKTPGQVALAWLMNQDIQVFPIVGPRDPNHLREDLGAADIRLTRDHVARLAGDM